MESTKFKRQIEELEREGYQFEGSYIACPAVGGDHELEQWVHPKKEAVVEVCQHCQTVSE